MTEPEQIFKAFKKVNVLIIGDVMTDRYLTGKVTRISPEAPVPIVESNREEERPGGAANVALNVRALSGNPILCSVVGKDLRGEQFLGMLKENGISNTGIIQSKNRISTVKTRVIAGGQHLLRVDREQKDDLNSEDENDLFQRVFEVLNTQKIDVILFQDYNKGVLTKSLITKIISEAQKRNIQTVIDPKFKNFWAFSGCTLVKPNLKEIRDALKEDVLITKESLNNACQILQRKLGNQFSMITLSEHGIYIHDGEKGEIIPTKPRKIADVCGAGDTVISVAALGFGAGLELKQIAELANLAGGLVCEKVGVVFPDKNQLIEEMR